MKKKFKFKNIIILALIIYASYILIGQQLVMYKIRQEKKVKIQELTEAKKTNKELQDKINMAKKDSYIERLAREKLNLIKKGETPVIRKGN